MNQSQYRADIDGLRAVAVLLVLVYHAGFSFISGGFIGVDVFFVISGYLITGIIKSEIEKGRFSLKKFYVRRIKRLIPALLGVLIVTSIFAVFLLLPRDLVSYAKSVISVIFSVSNMYFWRANGGYFEGSVHEVPLLHTWSLSVEEQFYLIWPFTLLLFAKYLNHFYFKILLLVSIFVAIYLSQWVSEVTFGASYYLLPTRMFELLMGATLAISWKTLPQAPKVIMDLLSVMGLALIVSSALVLTSASVFPGYNAVYPTLGAVLLIYSGKSQGSIMNKFLSLPVMVWFGLISYSLYLWHWPIVAFINYTGYELTTSISTGIVAVSILLGWLSWKYVETPFRKSKTVEFKPVALKMYVLPCFIATVLCVGIVFKAGFPDRFDEDVLVMDAAINSKPALLRTSCHSPSRLSHQPPNEECVLGAKDAPNARALLIGDSHSNHFTGFLDVIGEREKITIMDYTMDECLPIFGLNWGHNKYYSDICEKRNGQIQEFIKDSAFEYVILAGHWPTKNAYTYAFLPETGQVEQDQFKSVFTEKMIETIQFVKDSGATPVFIYDSSPNGDKSPKCVIQNKLFSNDKTCHIEKDLVLKRDEMIMSVVQTLQEHFIDLVVLNPKDAMCNDTICYSMIEGIPLFLDQNHLNDMGSRIIGKKYLELSQSPFSEH